MVDFKQENFTGGMNLLADASKLAENEYPLLFNGRHRNDYIRPVKKPLQITELPEGNRQGIYGAGHIQLAFVDGLAYYKNYETDEPWTQILDFQMSDSVPVLYAVLVDASTVNFKRNLTAEDKLSPVALTSNVDGSPKCAVVQDGVNQPWVIFPDGTARVTHTYAQWTDDDREYVPIGTLMVYVSGILYIVGPNSEIFRSVTGRPLDFVVNVTTSGLKGGDASTTSHRVTYNEITAIVNVATNAQTLGGFFVSTRVFSHFVLPVFDQLIFGEPQFRNIDLFPSGTLNQFSVIDVIGDTVFINQTGLRSFNAVQQTSFDGKNTPFSAKISLLFEGVIQETTCVGKMNNYVFFGVNTVYGPGVVVYDEITQQYVAVDQFLNVGAIKQFAQVKTSTREFLFFITNDGQFFQYEGSTVTATCKLLLGDWTTPEFGQLQNVWEVDTMFSDTEETGKAQVALFTDKLADSSQVKDLEEVTVPLVVPLGIPYGSYSKRASSNLSFTFQKTKLGWRSSFLISWNCMSNLLGINLKTKLDTTVHNFQEQAKTYAGGDRGPSEDDLVFAVTGNDGPDSEDKRAVARLIAGWNPSFVVDNGDINYPDGADSTWALNITGYWKKYIDQGNYYATLGDMDRITGNGQPFINNLRFPNNGRYYDVVRGDVHLFFMDSGYDGADVNQEPDGVNSVGRQALWMKGKLEASTSAWKVVFLHHPPFALS